MDVWITDPLPVVPRRQRVTLNTVFSNRSRGPLGEVEDAKRRKVRRISQDKVSENCEILYYGQVWVFVSVWLWKKWWEWKSERGSASGSMRRRREHQRKYRGSGKQSGRQEMRSGQGVNRRLQRRVKEWRKVSRSSRMETRKMKRDSGSEKCGERNNGRWRWKREKGGRREVEMIRRAENKADCHVGHPRAEWRSGTCGATRREMGVWRIPSGTGRQTWRVGMG